MTRSYYDARPSKFEAVGNGSYIYRWDIQEEDAPQQIMAEAKISPPPKVRARSIPAMR